MKENARHCMECWIQFLLYSVKQNESATNSHKEQNDKESVCFLLQLDSNLGGLQRQQIYKIIKHRLSNLASSEEVVEIQQENLVYVSNGETVKITSRKAT